MGAQCGSARVARGLLGLCSFLLLVCSGAGSKSKDKDTPTDELKLSSIKAHERNLQPVPPNFEARALFETLQGEETACEEQLGRGAVSDGNGGCHCYALEYRMENGTCREYRRSKAVLENEARKGLQVRLKGMAVCYSARTCSEQLEQRAASIDGELQNCSTRDAWLGRQVEVVNATLQRDLENRSSAAAAVQAWIKDLRTENQKMISELRKYAVLTEDNKRLKSDTNRIKGERGKLEARAETLKAELQAAKEERELTKAEVESEGRRCPATVEALRAGLEAAGLPLPTL